jgi:hypothetical protein
MRKESIEIYADTTNAAVLRHPGRKFPGVLIQGDTLYSMCQTLDHLCLKGRGKLGAEAFDELNEIRNQLWLFLNGYKATLEEHGIPLPFNEVPRA